MRKQRKSQNKNIRYLGEFGEKLTTKVLINRGHTIIERNFYSRYGEIDIISSYSDTLHIIEVKLRNSINFGYANEFVNIDKKLKIKKTFNYFLYLYPQYYEMNYSFDVVEVYPFLKKIRIIEGCF